MTPKSPDRNPYVGPRPFEPEDKELFFGRDREISDVLSLIIAHRVLLLYAPSGAGKTSLINAGLIPRLEGDGFEVLPLARVRVEIPEDIPPGRISNLYVFNTLMSWAEDGDALERLAEMSLADFLKRREHPTAADGLPRVVIFDQFEEVFAFYAHRWEDREGFFRQVAEALKEDELLRVVLVIREDYIAELDPYAHLLPDQLRTRYRLERLSNEAAIAAVRRPLAKARPQRQFDEGVAEKLVKNLMEVRVETAPGKIERVSGQFVEPVQLQVVCDALWRDLPPDVVDITKEHLRDFGDVTEALSRFYEWSLRAARDVGAREEDLRSLFEHTLITPAATRGTVFRGEKRTGAIPKAALGVLDRLLVRLRLKRIGGIPNEAVDVLDGRHLIREESRAGAHWYELTHDRLIEPIQESNRTWRERKGRRARRVAVSSVTAAVVVGVTVSVLTGVWETDDGAGFSVPGEGFIQSLDPDTDTLVIVPPVDCDVLGERQLSIVIDPDVNTERVRVDRTETTDEGCRIFPEDPLQFDHKKGVSVGLDESILLDQSDPFHFFIIVPPGTDCVVLGDEGRTILIDPGGDNEEQVEVDAGEEVSKGLCFIHLDEEPLEPLQFDHFEGEAVSLLPPENLTNNAAADFFPAWSPDGDRIAFTSERDGNLEIYAMNADGSGQTNLTNNPAGDFGPAWSSGDRIAFTSDRDGNGEIYVMNADGSGLTRLTDNPADDFLPAWSPDGSRIAFVSDRFGNPQIHVMNADGSRSIRLTDDLAADFDPPWSSGDRIVFTSDRDGNPEIYAMNADGSNLTRLTDHPDADLDPAWSPDGSRITFVSERDGNPEIYIMNADGSDLTRLTSHPAADGDPAWSSGDRIAFTSDRNGNFDIYVLPQ